MMPIPVHKARIDRYGRIEIIITIMLLLLWGCAATPPTPPKGYPKPYKIAKKWYQPIPRAMGFEQKGKASWYGKKFHGKKTASGETYNMHAMTAAHKTLPLGTYVKVRNLRNGRVVTVKINDRGPFVRGRIIDLSYKAAKKLGIVGPGTAPVKIVTLPRSGFSRSFKPEPNQRGNFTIQVAAFKNPKEAERLRKKLSSDYKRAHVVAAKLSGTIYYRVRVGQCTSLTEALQYEATMIARGFEGAFVVAE